MRFLGTLGLGLLLSAPAMAEAPTYNWSGFYAGANLGTASETQLSNVVVNGVPVNLNPAQTGNGLLAGGTIGWNWHPLGSIFVAGVEGDFDWSGISMVQTAGCSSPCHHSIQWLATARVRVGKAVGDTLFYATGGAAFASIHGDSGVFYNTTETRTGWTAGAGIEKPLAPHWTVKLEYLYASFGAGSCVPLAPLTCALNQSAHVQMMRGGLNYWF